MHPTERHQDENICFGFYLFVGSVAGMTLFLIHLEFQNQKNKQNENQIIISPIQKIKQHTIKSHAIITVLKRQNVK